MKNLHELEPRVSVLEKGQIELQRELGQLSVMVKEQGAQLTNAIANLSQNQSNNSKELFEKINSLSRTDWQTILTFVGVLIVLIGAILTPVWMSFNFIDSKLESLTEQVNRHEVRHFDSLEERAILRTKLELIEREKHKSLLP